MDRRSFLRFASGFAAGVLLPAASIATASNAEIDAAWQHLSANPLRFCVDQCGTIWDPTESDPERRRDLYPEVDPSAWLALDGVKRSADSCQALNDFLASEAEMALAELEDDPEEPAAARWKKVCVLLDKDPAHDWHAWVQTMDAVDFEAFKTQVQDWLDDGLDERDIELNPQIGRQGSAMAFFEGFRFAELKALGVVIVEGDRPGSTYYAAELRTGIEKANAAAARMNLPLRFEEGEQW